MNDYVEACTDEERSTTTDHSVTMDVEPEEQIPGTVHFTTEAESLPSTWDVNADSTGDQTTENDSSTSFIDVASAKAQVTTPADDDYDDYCNISCLSFVYAFERNHDTRIVTLLLMRLLR